MKRNTVGESILAGIVLAAGAFSIIVWGLAHDVVEKAEAQVIGGGGPAGPQGPAGAGDVWRTYIFVDNAPYSAVGDGTANDAAAIKSAINAAQAQANGGIVVFGAKDYLIQDDSLQITMDSIILRGSGNTMITGGVGATGTRLIFDQTAAGTAVTNPSCIKIGHQGSTVSQSGLQYLTVETDDFFSGHLVYMVGVEDCFVDHCVLEMIGADNAGRAALVINSESAVSCTNNLVSNTFILCPRQTSSEGFGVLMDATSSGFNNRNRFYGVKIATSSEPGACLKILSTSGSCNSHSFVQCDFGVPDLRTNASDDNDAGILLDDTDRNQFIGGAVDGDPDDEVLTMTGTCERGTFMLSIDGSIGDDQTLSDRRSVFVELSGAGSGGSAMNLSFPWFGLVNFTGSEVPSNLANGTMFYRTNAGKDSLFCQMAGSLRLIFGTP